MGRGVEKAVGWHEPDMTSRPHPPVDVKRSIVHIDHLHSAMTRDHKPFGRLSAVAAVVVAD